MSSLPSLLTAGPGGTAYPGSHSGRLAALLSDGVSTIPSTLGVFSDEAAGELEGAHHPNAGPSTRLGFRVPMGAPSSEQAFRSASSYTAWPPQGAGVGSTLSGPSPVPSTSAPAASPSMSQPPTTFSVLSSPSGSMCAAPAPAQSQPVAPQLLSTMSAVSSPSLASSAAPSLPPSLMPSGIGGLDAMAPESASSASSTGRQASANAPPASSRSRRLEQNLLSQNLGPSGSGGGSASSGFGLRRGSGNFVDSLPLPLTETLSSFGTPNEWWHDSIILGRLSAVALKYFSAKCLRSPWKAWRQFVNLSRAKRNAWVRQRSALALRNWHHRALVSGKRMKAKMPLLRVLAKLPLVVLRPVWSRLIQAIIIRRDLTRRLHLLYLVEWKMFNTLARANYYQNLMRLALAGLWMAAQVAQPRQTASRDQHIGETAAQHGADTTGASKGQHVTQVVRRVWRRWCHATQLWLSSAEYHLMETEEWLTGGCSTPRSIARSALLHSLDGRDSARDAAAEAAERLRAFEASGLPFADSALGDHLEQLRCGPASGKGTFVRLDAHHQDDEKNLSLQKRLAMVRAITPTKSPRRNLTATILYDTPIAEPPQRMRPLLLNNASSPPVSEQNGRVLSSAPIAQKRSTNSKASWATPSVRPASSISDRNRSALEVVADAGPANSDGEGSSCDFESANMPDDSGGSRALSPQPTAIGEALRSKTSEACEDRSNSYWTLRTRAFKPAVAGREMRLR